jgi:serine/threonine-protein kinase
MKTCPKCGGSFELAEKFCPRDGQVLDDAQQDLIGKVLDNQYEIEAFVASGGMGTVYRARHILLGDRVAIKVLLPEFRANPEWLRRFQREGQAARRFSHPNAVAVYDLRTSSEGLVYMVMEFVEGCPLDEELKRRGRYSPEEALEVLEPVGRVLEAAHRQGVVHRDLKPANVMVKRLEDGGVWIELLDLGIAKLSDFKDTGGNDGSPLTVAGQMLGTPYYMSPEQWGERQRDGNPQIDGRADIYSLGLMFYELISGARPFEAKTLVELRLFHAAITPKRLDAVVPGVSEEFARVVERAMAKDRADRYANAAAFVEDLRAALGLPAGHSTTSLTGSTASLTSQAASFTPPADAPPQPRAVSLTQPTLNVPDAMTSPASLTTPSVPNVPAPDTANLPATHAQNETAAQHELAAQRESAAQREGFEPPPTLIANDQAAPPAFAPASVPPPRETTPLAPASFAPEIDAARAYAAQQSASSAQQSAASMQQSASSSTPQPVVGSFGPVAPVAHAAQQDAPPRVRKKSRAPLIVIALVVLLAVCAGIAGTGWFLWSRWQQARVMMTGAPPPATAESDTKPADATTSGATIASDAKITNDAKTAGARVEALSYWIESFDSADQKEGVRVAQSGAFTLASGQQFKFHFSPASRGFLYVVGPGARNAPTTFLTAEPTTGLLKTNLAAAGADFSFPYGAGQVLQLDKNPGTEEYTVIFSETPLMEPKFLATRGGHALTPAESKQLEDLRALAGAASPAQDVKETGDGARAVSVTVPKDADAAGLVVFDVRIEHH